MIRKVFKRGKPLPASVEAFIRKHNISPEYLTINRRSVSKAFLIGLFIALIPMPFQMLAVVAVTPFVRFNVPIALALCWLSNPFTMPPMYYVEYLTGCKLLGIEPIHDIALTVDWFKQNLADIFIPLYVGTFFYGFTLAPAAYFLTNWLWIRSVHRQRSGGKS